MPPATWLKRWDRSRCAAPGGLPGCRDRPSWWQIRSNAFGNGFKRTGNGPAVARLAAVGELAAGIADELRNSLTSVKLIIQTAVPGEGGYSLDERAYRIVEEEIGRLERTIQGLLDFARPPVLRRVRHDLRVTVRCP